MRDFEEYKKLGEPEKARKSEIWQTAIGLQQVDGLTPSKYLIDTAHENIEGNITIGEVKKRINSYYQAKPSIVETEEADKVSAHIVEVLSENTFTFSPAELITIHKRLFEGVYDFAGKLRNYNIAKDEWVLDDATVLYASAESIKATLDYDFAQEKAFDYRGLTKRQKVEHIAEFVSNMWQIHPFGEGNTRTTAVFTIKYLRSFGFEVTNDLFSEHSWYFRNALVRANYNDYNHDIFSTNEYLLRFFCNLLLGENNELRNRDLHIRVKENDTVDKSADTNCDTVNLDNDTVNDNNDTVNDTVNTSGDTVNDSLLTLIASNPRITAIDISQKLNIGIATAKRRLKKLKDSGVIERVGSDKSGYWQVK